MAEHKDTTPESGADAASGPRLKVLGELRDGVFVVLDTETGKARLAYSVPQPRKVSRFWSFLEGFASAFDLCGGADASDQPRGFERDAMALRKVWQNVGSDLRMAMNKVAVHG